MPGSNAVTVAELTLGHMIALARHTVEADRAVKENRWSDYLRFIGLELAGKTLGIVGMGNIGTRVALRARAFEMSLLVYDPYIPASHVTALGGQWVSLDELSAGSDFVTLHCPLNSETRHMIGERQFASMKKTAYLVNLARRGGRRDARSPERAAQPAAIGVLRPSRARTTLLQLRQRAAPEWGSTREAQSGAMGRGGRGGALEGKSPRNPVPAEARLC
jgi:D-3-phosphoglycerate dehydrogenase